MRLRFGSCVFDDRLHELTRDGVRVELSPKAFTLLRQLIGARPEPQTHEALYQTLWPGTFVEPGNLHNVIAEIRSALGDREHELVRTIHRVGYAFAAEVRTEEPSRFTLVVGESEVVLAEGECTIGRDPACDVVIDIPEASRRHATLIVHPAHVVLHDLGSKNGTYANGVRVEQPVVLGSGDEIVIGGTVLRLMQSDALAPTATAG